MIKTAKMVNVQGMVTISVKKELISKYKYAYGRMLKSKLEGTRVSGPEIRRQKHTRQLLQCMVGQEEIHQIETRIEAYRTEEIKHIAKESK